MDKNENINYLKMLPPIIIYALLMYLWFDANDKDGLIFVGGFNLPFNFYGGDDGHYSNYLA